MKTIYEYSFYITVTISTLIFVQTTVGHDWSRRHRLFFSSIVAAAIFCLVGLYWLAFDEKPDETLFRVALCPFVDFKKCNPVEIPATIPDNGAQQELARQRARQDALEKRFDEIAKSNAQTPIKPKEEAASNNPPTSYPRNPDTPSPVSKAAVASTPPSAGQCVVVGFRIERPIPVEVGSNICSKDGTARATVLEITSYSLSYSNPGRGTDTCQISEKCAFNWDHSPSFNVDIVEGFGKGERSARLVNAR